MKNIKPSDQNRRRFFKSAGLLSLSISIPILAKAGNRIKKQSLNDQTIEIRTGNKVTVLISVFKVEPGNVQKLAELFEEGTLNIFSKQPGYISSSIHKGSGADRLVLYGQWENQQAIEAFRKKPEVGEYFQRVKELSTYESVVCNDVTFVHHR